MQVMDGWYAYTLLELSMARFIVVLQVAVTSVLETVREVKGKLADVVGVAANKQKLLSANGAVMVDTYTLAFYNVSTGTKALTLQLKERGGRKK
jgi:hypothetical protein